MGLYRFTPAYAQVAAPTLASGLELYGKGDFTGCAKIFLALAKQQQTRAIYWMNLGNCLFMAERYGQAYSAYSRAVATKGGLRPAAQLYQAKALSKLNRKDEAKATLVELIRSNPPPGLMAEARQDLKDLISSQVAEGKELTEESGGLEAEALQLYRSEKYREAERKLRQKSLRELSGEARLLLALSMMKQNKSQAATEVLKSALSDSELESAQRNSALGLLAQLREEKTGTSNAWIFVETAYGASSNVYLEGRSYSPIASPLLRAALGAGAGFQWGGPSWSQKFGYSLDYENPEKAPELQTQIHSLFFPLGFRGTSFVSNLTPQAQQQIWNNIPASRKTGGVLNLAHRGKDYEVGLDIEDMSQKSLNEQFSYLEGRIQSGKIYYSLWGPKTYAQIFWLQGWDGTQDILYGDGALLPLRHSFQGPGARVNWQISSTWSLLFNVTMMTRVYSTLALPSSELRRDQETSASLKLHYLMSPRWKSYVLTEYNPNTSTLGTGDVRDKNYTNINYFIGLAWEAF